MMGKNWAFKARKLLFSCMLCLHFMAKPLIKVDSMNDLFLIFLFS